LSLFRRDESGHSRARRARRLCARMQPTSSVRLVPEELESRVLLSAGPFEGAPALFALNLPIKAAAISTLAQPSFANSQPLIAEGGFNNGISESGISRIVLARLRLPTDTAPPTLVLVGQALPDGNLPTSSTAVNEWSPPLDAEQVPPLLVIAGTGSSSNVGFATTSTANPEHGQEGPVPLNGPGQVNLASAFEQAAEEYANSPGEPNWPAGADVKRVEVTGTLSSDQTTMIFDVPVDAQTESVGVNLQAMGGGSNAPPIIGLMDLVNPAGTTMAQISPPSGPGASVLQGMTVQVHNATNGSHVLIQITTAEPLSGSAVGSSSGTGSANTPAPSPASNDDVSFVLDVQRQDAPTAVEVSGTPVQAAVLMGTLVLAPTPQSGSSVSSSTATESAGEDAESAPAAQSAVMTVGPTTTALSAAPEPPSDSLDSFNVRVSTGPFASRSASPLGPSLASIDAEATQQVDRHERAMSQEIEGLEPVDGEQSTVWRSEDTDEESSSRPGNHPGSSGFAGTARPVVDVLGSGGYPMMVTSPGRGQQAQVSDLWATLPSFADSESSASSSTQAAISLREGPKTSTTAGRSSSDSAKSPDYVKAAFGLAFGLLMTSGPLFPDLIAKLSRRIPKSLAALRARTGRATSPWRRRHPLGAISTWIRGLFVPL
jgi:hypothetical protein